MDGKNVEETRVIRCTEANAREFAAAIRRWPEAHALARELHAAGYFSGLRAAQIVLTGSAEWVGRGLDAIPPENGSEAATKGAA